MVNDRTSVQELLTPYVVEPQVKIYIPLSVLFQAVECLNEDGLRQLRQWVDERLDTLPAEVNVREGKPGKTLTRFAGWIPLDDLTLMRDAIENGCEW